MANTYTLIGSYIVGSGGVANIEFTSIPATYTDLNILFSIRANGAFSADNLAIQFNSSTANFSWKNLYGRGSGSPFSQNTADNNAGGVIPAGNMTASATGSGSIYIPNYASANYKSFSSDTIAENAATLGDTVLTVGLWSNTAAITTIKLLPSTGSFVEHSTAYLYGIKNS
jgi:hypothetical protein